MRIEMEPLSMAEAEEIVETSEDKEISSFIKKFSKLEGKQAMELKTELENLGLMKVKAEHIAKIIDLLPEDAVDINKIFIETSLDENEINKLLEIIKKYK